MQTSFLVKLYEGLAQNMRYVEENFDGICFELLKQILRLHPECGKIGNRWISDYHDFVTISFDKESNEVKYTEMDENDEETEEKDLFMLNNTDIISVVEEVVSNYEKLENK